jgi:hypothetical protein
MGFTKPLMNGVFYYKREEHSRPFMNAPWEFILFSKSDSKRIRPQGWREIIGVESEPRTPC